MHMQTANVTQTPPLHRCVLSAGQAVRAEAQKQEWKHGCATIVWRGARTGEEEKVETSTLTGPDAVWLATPHALYAPVVAVHCAFTKQC